MSSDQLKTSVLYQVGNYKVFISEYNADEQKAIKELLADGFLRLVSDNLQLTAAGDLITRYNLDYTTIYDQFHSEHFETEIKNPEVAAGYNQTQTSRLERKFLKFLNKKTTALSTEIDIEEFMIANFKKPNPKSSNTINSTDKGVIFLKNLKLKGAIDFDNEALSHVNKWTVDSEGETKRWFDTLHEPLYITLERPLSQFLSLSERLLNKKIVLKQTKYAIRKGATYGISLFVGIWKFIILVLATFLGGWLALDHNFMYSVHWIQNHLFKK